jgi:hypothetical protein
MKSKELFFAMCSTACQYCYSQEFWAKHEESFHALIESCMLSTLQYEFWETCFAISMMLYLKFENFLPNSSIYCIDVLQMLQYIINSIEEHHLFDDASEKFKMPLLLALFSLCTLLYDRYKLEANEMTMKKLFIFANDVVKRSRNLGDLWSNKTVWKWIWKKDSSSFIEDQKSLLALQFIDRLNGEDISAEMIQNRYAQLLPHVRFSESNVDIFIEKYIPIILENFAVCEFFLQNKLDDFISAMKAGFTKLSSICFSSYLLTFNSISKLFHGLQISKTTLEVFFDLLKSIYQKNMENFALVIFSDTLLSLYHAITDNGSETSHVLSFISCVYHDMQQIQSKSFHTIAELLLPLISSDFGGAKEKSFSSELLFLVHSKTVDDFLESHPLSDLLDFNCDRVLELALFKALNFLNQEGSNCFRRIICEFFTRSQGDLLISLISQNSWTLHEFSQIDSDMTANHILFVWIFFQSNWIHAKQVEFMLVEKCPVLLEKIAESIRKETYCCHGEMFRYVSIILHLRRASSYISRIMECLKSILQIAEQLDPFLCKTCIPYKSHTENLHVWKRTVEIICKNNHSADEKCDLSEENLEALMISKDSERVWFGDEKTAILDDNISP